MCNEAGRPLPPFSDDDVVDFMVTEAVIVKVGEERKKIEDDAKRKAWREDHAALVKQDAAVGKL